MKHIITIMSISMLIVITQPSLGQAEIPTAPEEETAIPPSTEQPPAAMPETPPTAMPEAQAPSNAASTMPTPDASMAPAPAPGAEVKVEQFTWPDTAELDEQQKDLAQTSNPAILSIFKQTEASLTKMKEIINELIKKREELYKEYFDLDSQLDAFHQSISTSTGTVQQSFEPVEK